MANQPDTFRDFGIIPDTVSPPAGPVRSSLSGGQRFGQYLGTCLMSGFGLGIGALFALTLRFPLNVLAAAAVLAAFGCLVYLATRNDYAWIELDGDKLRARHLYTRRIVERSTTEVVELLTLVFRVRTTAALITEKWLGRVRGIEIRFRDKRKPLRVSRADPAMKNAKELIEAIVYQMWRTGDVDAEVIDFAGKPMIRRIYRKEPGVTQG